MKRILAFLIIGMVLCGMCVSAESVPTIVVGSAQAVSGETIIIPVSFENNPGIASFTLGVSYDSSKLRFEGFDFEDSGLPGSFETGAKITWFAMAESDYSGRVFDLKFTLLDAAPIGATEVSVTYKEGDICNWNLDDVNFEVCPGSVSIPFMRDITADGSVDSNDLVALRKILLGLASGEGIDVNGDGSLNIKDLVALKHIV